MANLKLANLSSRILWSRLTFTHLNCICISFHWSWLPSVLLLSVFEKTPYSTRILIVPEIALIFVIVLIHELAHAASASWMGCPAKEIVFVAFGGVTLFRNPLPWLKQLFVAASGPATNLALAPVTFLIWYWFGYSRGGDLSQLLWRIAWANVAMTAFNLLPIWPLDGGVVLQAAITARFGITRSRTITGAVSIICIVPLTAWMIHLQHFFFILLLGAIGVLNSMIICWSMGRLAEEKRWGFHPSAKCPYCRGPAVDAPVNICNNCGQCCNALMHEGRCWKCGAVNNLILCSFCGTPSSAEDWLRIGNDAITHS